MAQKRNVAGPRAGTQFDDRPSKKARNAVDDDFEPSSSLPANSSQSARTPIVNPGALTRRIESEKETRNEPSVHPSTTAVQTLPKKTARRPIETCGDPGLMTHIFEKNDFSFMELKEDHVIRPLWINPADASVILEGFSPIAEQVQDFLVAIGEPISRPTFMHEYKITAYSLYAAVSIGLETNDIISVLSHLSKTPVPESIIQLIMDCTVSYGKIKLVLKRNRYHVETTDPKVLKMLLEDPIVASARVTADGMGQITSELRGLLGSADSQNAEAAAASTAPPITAGATRGMVAVNGTRNREPHTDLFASVVGAASDDNDEDDQNSHSFEVSHAKLDDVKKRCLELDYPLLEEYDFRNDTVNPQLNIDLKPLTVIRPYQEKCLGKMFSNGRARSGIIVLPCGAGKTLVGITAACTIKKTCLVLCTSGVSVLQWQQQFLQWSNIHKSKICAFTADHRAKLTADVGIVVSTYSMVAHTGKRSADAKKMMDFLTSREWGLVILDEVHVVPADMFRRVVTTIKAHSKLGLTATLVREDDRIEDLNYMIGPKLYEANWMELAAKGHIATVQCAEVWCPMTSDFYYEYLKAKNREKVLLWCMNPNKLQACQFLIDYHEKRGDKIIVFSDNVFTLKEYARRLGKPFICGGVSQNERVGVLQAFQQEPSINTIFLSKVGDTSIDLPEATCLIQISSHFGSRRQEAQRLGRILRAKRRNDEGFNAYFYSLVSKDTQEMYYSTKRQQFLIDQGYSFRVITRLDGIERVPGLVLQAKSEQIELLNKTLRATEEDRMLGSDVARGEGDLAGTVTSNIASRPIFEEES